jgi:acyl-coenzyme A synthetase/AMP-(fatty) acid ligase
MVRASSGSLWDRLNAEGRRPEGSLNGAVASVALAELARCSSLGGRLEELRGTSVLVWTREQLAAALALIELDGVARRLVLCPPGLPLEHVPAVISTADVEAVVSDEAATGACADVGTFVTCGPHLLPLIPDRIGRLETEWILLTSGTTGRPKLVSHTLRTLSGAIARSASAADCVWSTFYDIRRYGGLQILLRALLGGGSLVLSSPDETLGEFLGRAAARGITHISGTPSHWRRALMTSSARRIAPRYVRLSGEIADQAILDSLRACYPEAVIAHAFASTEAGVAFEVGDGLAGFPARLIGQNGAVVEMKVEEGSLRIRSARTATSYLGGEPLKQAHGFVDTGDQVERRGDRYYFVGRTDGVVNVGGLKVHPEEVEAVINHHPSVQMSRVKARKNPIMGAVVVAEVVVKAAPDDGDSCVGSELLKSEILDACQRALAPHKVPAAIRFVPTIEVTAAGKMARRDA